MDELGRLRLSDACWKIEEYHRSLKQVTNVKGCQCRKANAQRVHIGLGFNNFWLSRNVDFVKKKFDVNQ